MRKISIFFALCLIPGAVMANGPIMSVPQLVDPLVEAAAADKVRRGCGDFSVNMIRAYAEARKLKSDARKMGYSEDEIQDFIRGDANKAEVKKRAAGLLARLGADGTREGLCAAGDALVARGGVASRLISR